MDTTHTVWTVVYIFKGARRRGGKYQTREQAYEALQDYRANGWNAWIEAL